jgi:L-aspartate oxidase
VTELSADVLIIGSGIAGLCSAIECEGLNVHLVTKATLSSGASSFWAQGGIAAAIAAYDSPRLHTADTIVAGAGLSEPDVTDILTHQAQDAVDFLTKIGTKFDLDQQGNFAFAREGAHRVPRVLHANHDATGAELMRALGLAASRASHITIHEHAHAIELVVDDYGTICGAIIEKQGEKVVFRTPRIVLATGGAGQLFAYTTNPPEAKGEGLALAARVGAFLTDIEFVQFHPTALYVNEDPLPLISEALRGEGAWLIDENGNRFMVGAHEQAELAPRDVVARAVWAVQHRGGKAFLDARPTIGDEFPSVFPNIFERCMEAGIDPRIQPIPIVPAAHYHMGGVAVDPDGRSTVAGLWACGEVSSTGIHGANRLASNSLLEAVVFGKRVAESASTAITAALVGPDKALERAVNHVEVTPDEPQSVQLLRDTMWAKVGLMRDDAGLGEAITTFQTVFEDRARSRGVRHRAWICWAMAQAARDRRESRGAHHRTDFPDENFQLKRHSRMVWEEEARAWRIEFEQDLIPAGS